MKVVLIRFREGERRDLLLSTETTIIGRRPDCQLRIPTRDVSRRHCEIALSDKEVRVRDLGSSNGTYVNGKRVSDKPLAAGDRLMVGPVVFVVQIDGEPQEIKPVASRPLLQPVGKQVTMTEPEEGEDLDDGGQATITTPAREEIDLGRDEVFELTADDFDLEDAISALDELDEEDDLP
jgi:pSer/pThr/pTyr-binding forkhead associated (FHA) protein